MAFALVDKAAMVCSHRVVSSESRHYQLFPRPLVLQTPGSCHPRCKSRVSTSVRSSRPDRAASQASAQKGEHAEGCHGTAVKGLAAVLGTVASLSCSAAVAQPQMDALLLKETSPMEVRQDSQRAELSSNAQLSSQQVPLGSLTAPSLTNPVTPVQEVAQLAAAPPASAAQELLEKASFGLLFAGMLAYWGQAAFSSSNPNSPSNSNSGSTSSESNSIAAGTALNAAANLALAALLTDRWIESGHFPVSNLYESLLFLSWGISAVSLALERGRGRLAPLAGAVLTPLALGSAGFAVLSLPAELQRAGSLVPALQSNWLLMHVSVMILSYAVLLSGSLLAMAYLVVDTFGWDHRNPEPAARRPRIRAGAGLEELLQPAGAEFNAELVADSSVSASRDATAELESVQQSTSGSGNSLAEDLDNLSYRTLGLGFPLLTIGILSGAVWANSAWGSYWSWDPKETWALITWLVYAIYLHTRITKGWQGRPPAIVATAGFFVVWICYIGVNLLGIGLHSYGWFLK